MSIEGDAEGRSHRPCADDADDRGLVGRVARMRMRVVVLVDGLAVSMATGRRLGVEVDAGGVEGPDRVDPVAGPGRLRRRVPALLAVVAVGCGTGGGRSAASG